MGVKYFVVPSPEANELAEAMGIEGRWRKVVLTLEAGKVARVEIERHAEAGGVGRLAAAIARIGGRFLKMTAPADPTSALPRGLAEDFASFFNLPIGEARRKLGAAMAGRNCLREYGVDLSHRAVTEEVYELKPDCTDAGRYRARASLIAKGLERAREAR